MSELPLGKAVTYDSAYDRALLFPLPRAEGRARLGIAEPLPFFGCDIWNGYELSWLNAAGKPVWNSHATCSCETLLRSIWSRLEKRLP